MMQKNRLGSESIGTLFWRLALPAVTAQLVNMLYNLVDRMYIGHIKEIGPMALTGVGISMPIIMLIAAFAMLIGAGGAPHVSIALGAGDTETAIGTLNTAKTATVVFGLVLTILFSVFLKPVLHLLGASEASVPYALAYSRIYILGTIPVMISLGLNYFISAQGFAAIAMRTTLIGAFVNIVLDPLFIFVFRMGVAGAAVATLIAQCVSAAWVLRFLCGPGSQIRLSLRGFRMPLRYLLPILALGLSPFIMVSTESLLQITFNRALFRYGGDLYVGTMSINILVMQMVVMPLGGITQGTTSIVSYNYGARDFTRVKAIVRLMITVCVLYGVTAWLLTLLFPQLFTGIFTKAPELTAATIRTMRIYCLGFFAVGLQISCQQCFIAFGQAKISMLMALLRKIILLIPLIFLLPKLIDPPVYGVYWAEPIADVTAAAVTATMFFRFLRRVLAEEGAGRS